MSDQQSTKRGTVVRYHNFREDSARWNDFASRPDDIVITTPVKAGTTWLQMICALLVFATPDLPGPLAQLSPWVDSLLEPADRVHQALAVVPRTVVDSADRWLPGESGVSAVVVGRFLGVVATPAKHRSCCGFAASSARNPGRAASDREA